MKKLLAVLAIIIMAVSIVGCNNTDADVASKNLKVGAEQFEIYRRVVFYNGITDTYIATFEGFCSIENPGGRLDLTCKTGPDSFVIHYLYLSDNVSFIVEQLEGVDVNTYRYKRLFKPETIAPDIDLKVSTMEDGKVIKNEDYFSSGIMTPTPQP